MKCARLKKLHNKVSKKLTTKGTNNPNDPKRLKNQKSSGDELAHELGSAEVQPAELQLRHHVDINRLTVIQQHHYYT